MEFKAESKRLLDLMINSIYTHKEIFLRELISNASDAMDKLYYRSLQGETLGLTREEMTITIKPDKTARMLTLSDNGIGMTREELEENLGTIAKSGSFSFKNENNKSEDIDIIGQFGVGFYSAFMVSSKVTVITRAYGSDKAYKWESYGSEGYTIEECEKGSHGTDVILYIKDDTEDEHYDEFLDQYRLKGIVTKYSDYIRYPILMDMERSQLKEGSDKEYETVTETKTLNSMVPIWKKNKSELKDEDYNAFYKDKFHDFEDPLKVIHMATEGSATYHAMLFIPARAPYNYYTKEYEKGLQLYASGVLIMERCAELLPDCFSFVKGLVDSQDLSLNISREMLQHDRQLKVIAGRLEKKIKSELLSLLNNERETYEKIFKNFGLQLKYGLYGGFGVNKELLKDLLLFYSSSEKKLVSIPEYISRMKEEQKYIYYCAGESAEKLDKLPQTELLKDKGYEILYFTDDVDEFAIRMLHEYDGKEFRSASGGDLGIDLGDDKQEEKQKENEGLLTFMKEALDGKVSDVKLSARLKSHPVCLTAAGELSLEMEKVLGNMPGDGMAPKAEKVLELNGEHRIFEVLTGLFGTDDDKLKALTQVLYNQALLIEGLPIDDPVAYTNAVCGLL